MESHISTIINLVCGLDPLDRALVYPPCLFSEPRAVVWVAQDSKWKIKIWIGLSFDTTWDVITRVFPRFKQFACFPEEFPLVFLILFMK